MFMSEDDRKELQRREEEYRSELVAGSLERIADALELLVVQGQAPAPTLSAVVAQMLAQEGSSITLSNLGGDYYEAELELRTDDPARPYIFHVERTNTPASVLDLLYRLDRQRRGIRLAEPGDDVPF